MLSPGTVLQGRYGIARRLGQGGTGTVYEAVDERVSATVVVEEADEATDENERREFEREARRLVPGDGVGLALGLPRKDEPGRAPPDLRLARGSLGGEMTRGIPLACAVA